MECERGWRSNTSEPSHVRHENSRAVCESGSCLCPQRVSQSHQPRFEQRCRCSSTEEAYACVLRLLRLAFFGTRSLASGSPGTNFSRRPVRGSGSRCLATEPDGRKSRAGGGLPSGGRTRQLRASVWACLAASTHG